MEETVNGLIIGEYEEKYSLHNENNIQQGPIFNSKSDALKWYNKNNYINGFDVVWTNGLELKIWQ